ncbi:MAG: HEPN domain-containing protein [Chitinophagales bacterium]
MTNTYVILISKAQENLEDATFLYEERGSKESAVSRTYYSMYYATEATLLTKGVVAHSHSGQIAQFSLHFIKTNEIPLEYGKMLGKALEKDNCVIMRLKQIFQILR